MMRDAMIEMLVNDDLEFFQKSPVGAAEYFSVLMVEGFDGYNNFTDKELEDELRERGLV